MSKPTTYYAVQSIQVGERLYGPGSALPPLPVADLTSLLADGKITTTPPEAPPTAATSNASSGDELRKLMGDLFDTQQVVQVLKGQVGDLSARLHALETSSDKKTPAK